MYTDLTAFLGDLASRLQSVALFVPISQLSLVSWLMFVITGSVGSQKPFNAAEHGSLPISKLSFQ